MDNNYGYNSYNAYEGSYSTTESDSRIMTKAFILVVAGLILTALTSTIVAVNPNMFIAVANTFTVWLIAELVVVVVTSIAIQKQNSVVAGIGYFLYSIVNGITLSCIFYVYELGSIYQVFFISAAMFAGMAVLGLFTSIDLTKIGSIAMMLLWGVIIATLVNALFIRSVGFDMLMDYVVVVLFCGITAYDMQKLKSYAKTGASSNTVAIYFGMNLYLDFINIFLRLLRLFGKRR